MPLNFFVKNPIPENLPKDMDKIISDLKKSKDKEDCLKKTYIFLSNKYRGYRVKTYSKLFSIFKQDINYIWGKNGFMHCTNINYIARILLIKSEFFKEEDIRLKWTMTWYVSPHQYLKVRVNKQWINIDIWAHPYGIKFGEYAKGFK